MSIASEITRIAGLRDTIRTKLIDFGIITDSSAKLTDCATAIEGIDEATLTVPSLSIMANPTIDNTTGLVSVSGNANGTVSASKGYSKGLNRSISVPVSGNLQLATQAAQTITPGTSNKTIAANRWLTGTQIIKGDSNLVAANILSGKSIFGVAGSASRGVAVKEFAAGTLPVVTRTCYEYLTNEDFNLSCAQVDISGFQPITFIISYARSVIKSGSDYLVPIYYSGWRLIRTQKSGNTLYIPLDKSYSSSTVEKTSYIYGYQS